MLTPSDLKTLRRLLDKAGNKTEFQREVKRARQLPKRGRGRPARNDDDLILFVLQFYCLVGRWAGIKQNTILRAALTRGDNRFGKTNDAAVRRFAKRLRDPAFKKRFSDANRSIFKSLKDPDPSDESLSAAPKYCPADYLNPGISKLLEQAWDRGPPSDKDATRERKSWAKEYLKSIAR
jgi:hypothetical protein